MNTLFVVMDVCSEGHLTQFFFSFGTLDFLTCVWGYDPLCLVQVGDVKELIRKDPAFAESGLKLLFNGKVLEDESTLSSYDIKENSVIIMMATRAKPGAGGAGSGAAAAGIAGGGEKASEKSAEAETPTPSGEKAGGDGDAAAVGS